MQVLGSAANASLEQKLALGLGQAAPDTVGLADSQRVGAALCHDRALTAHLLGAQLALRAGAATFAVGVKEHGGIDASAQA